jgi:hypothetical protein
MCFAAHNPHLRGQPEPFETLKTDWYANPLIHKENILRLSRPIWSFPPTKISLQIKTVSLPARINLAKGMSHGWNGMESSDSPGWELA